MKIDAHQHFWIFDAVRDSWINDDMQALRRDYLPDYFGPLLQAHGIDGCVAVQASQSLAENQFLLALAKEYSFIKGVVGWIDFEISHLAALLETYATEPLMKGFRHVLQGERQRDYMLRPSFLRGVGQLAAKGFTYDILILPDQLDYAITFARALPAQKLILDHLAKPFIKRQEQDPWRRQIKELAQCENVYCKVSGLVTEADWRHWQPEDFFPYLDTVLEAFGPQRLVFGSDWPVCEVAGGYHKVMDLIKQYISRLSPDEQEAFWGANAVTFYNL